MYKKFLLILILSLVGFNVLGVEEKLSKSDISYIDASVLGLVEGLTEYLPVSSTGHLILTNRFLSLDNDSPLLDKEGQVIVNKKASKKEGEIIPYTMKNAVDSYAVIIQIGAIFAVVFLYWQSVWEMILGFLGRSKKGLLLARNLFAAFLPAVVFGLLFDEMIESVLFGIYPVIFALFVGGLFMLFVQKKYEKKAQEKQEVELSTLTIKQSVIVGLLQCVAMWPGTSRSMMTILGGYIIGLNPKAAAKFSFLIGLITLSAASFYKILKDGQVMVESISVSSMLLGIFVSFVSALICVKWFVGFLSRRGLGLFAWYRIIFSAVLLLVFIR